MGLSTRGVILDFSRPGKPTDNSFIESFNGKLRAECLNTHWLISLDDARMKLEGWRRDYNEVRPKRDRQQGAGIGVEWLIGATADMSLTRKIPALAGLVLGSTSKPEQSLLINEGN